VIRQGGRQTKNILVNFLKIRSTTVALFYALYLGLVTSKRFNERTFLFVT